MFSYMDSPFQFHCGAIKSPVLELYGIDALNFNSIMVRLKVLLVAELSPVRLYFNSIVVRLKGSSF